jgi:hypothetical protein
VIWDLDNFDLDLLVAFAAGIVASVFWNGRDLLRLKNAVERAKTAIHPMRELVSHASALLIGSCSVIGAFFCWRSLAEHDGYSLSWLPVPPRHLPSSISDSVLYLLFAFIAGLGASFGARHGRQERLNQVRDGVDDPGARLVHWVGAPIVFAYASVGFAGFAIGILLVIWNAPEEWRKYKRDQPEVERFNRMIRSGQLQKDFDRIIQQKLQKRAEGQEAQRNNEGKISKEPESGTAH